MAVPPSRDDGESAARRLVRGVGAGAGAYLLSYLFTYVLVADEIRNSALNQVAAEFAGEPTTWRLVGWVFYNAHFVDTRVTVDIPLVGSTGAVNFVGGEGGFTVLLYVVPPLVLVAAGLFLGQLADVRDASEALRVGPAVAAGYLPLALLGTVLFAVSAGAASGQPDIVTAVGMAGVVYPVVFGGLGSLAATAT